MDDSLTAITSRDEVPGVDARARDGIRPGAGGSRARADVRRGGWRRQLCARLGVAGWPCSSAAVWHADGRRLLSEKLVDLSHEGQPGAANSGLGWHLSGAGVEPARIGHSGAGGASQQQQDLVPGSGYAVVVLLNSFTVWREHAYAISDGIIEITEGRDPEVGAPVPTMVDLALGGVSAAGGRVWACSGCAAHPLGGSPGRSRTVADGAAAAAPAHRTRARGLPAGGQSDAPGQQPDECRCLPARARGHGPGADGCRGRTRPARLAVGGATAVVTEPTPRRDGCGSALEEYSCH